LPDIAVIEQTLQLTRTGILMRRGGKNLRQLLFITGTHACQQLFRFALCIAITQAFQRLTSIASASSSLRSTSCWI
jgi:hypothetical protein